MTAPSGLPWGASTHLALCHAGVIEAPFELSHYIWGHFIKVFDGHYIALSCTLTAIAAGLIGVMVNRVFDWRVAIGVTIVWVFLPAVWNRTITGEYKIVVIDFAIIILWALSAIAISFFKNSIAPLIKKRVLFAANKWSILSNRIILGIAIIFGVGLCLCHDYQFGEAASSYARDIVDEAGDRIIVLNGIVDDQIVWEVKRREKGEVLFLNNDDAYRSNLVEWVRREWPSETNLWVAAQAGSRVFADIAYSRHPERFYLMNGKSTTLKKWQARWERFTPYFKSSDPFIPLARCAFALELNTIASRLSANEANEIYKRVGKELDKVPAIKSNVSIPLMEWNNEMVAAMDNGECERAANIARAILMSADNRNFIPANAVLGMAMNHEGDYVASERFFRAATATTNMIPPIVCNDFADTLMHLGKLDEAEKFAREAIRQTDESYGLPRLTLAEIKLEQARLAGNQKDVIKFEAEIRAIQYKAGIK